MKNATTSQKIVDLLMEKRAQNNIAHDQWARKAICSLVRRMISKKKKNGVTDLIEAITKPETHSPCITIPRSKDGRFQVLKKKGHPHVMFCQLWRWTELRSHHELQAIESCQYSFETKKDEVCVNPYHYERLEITVLSNVHIPKPESQPLPDYSSSRESVNLQTLPVIFPPASNLTEDVLMDIDGRCLTDDAPMTHEGGYPTNEFPTVLDTEHYHPVSYKEPAAWCSVSYHELGTRVGESFSSSNPSITIDGYTAPLSESRFCLGMLTNVNRTQPIEDVRRHIGKGVRLYYFAGEVFAECLSESSIFVQSAISNMHCNYHQATVCKVTSTCSLKIFDNKEFAQLLSESVAQGYKAVYELAQMCTIRLSLVKGWGPLYRRQQITSMPCWLEIHLNGPLQWVDNVLVEMGGPSTKCSSAT